MFWKLRRRQGGDLLEGKLVPGNSASVCALFGIAFFFVASIPNIPNGAIKEANPNGL